MEKVFAKTLKFFLLGIISVSIISCGGDDDMTTNPDPSEDPMIELLAETSSKTWYLQREGIALGVGSSTNSNDFWSFGGVTPLHTRPCVLDDSYTFFRDGSVTLNTNGTIFIDETANGGWEINGEDMEGCRDESESGVWGDNSARENFANGGDYTYTLNSANNSLAILGSGAYIGLANKTRSGDNNIPENAKSYTIFNFVDGGSVDSLGISLVGNSDVWNFYLVSYENMSDLPDIPVNMTDPDLPDVTPTEMFNTFAGTGPADVVNLIPTESVVELTIGVDDPADAAATKVGRYERGVTDPFSDLKFSLPFDVQFDNFSTVSLDVYFPSTNVYTGSLSQQVDIFIADGSEDMEFWTTWELYTDDSQTALDEWVTITFDLGNAKNRNDLDLVGLKIGGEDHQENGIFYVRNFRFE